jgi:hypothetical protein
MMEDKIPCPRFEFKWVKTGASWISRECIYSLVIPLRELDIRHTDNPGNPTEKTLEIGRTEVNGGNGEPPMNDGMVNTPFRDGAHARWDNESLGGHLPIVAVCDDFWNLVED